MQNSILQWFARKFLDRSLQPRELLTARKFVYTFLIIVLFTGSFFWRRLLVETQANDLAVREQSRGELKMSSSILQLSLTGLRGLVTCYMWVSIIDSQKMNQWNEVEYQVRWLTQLQPHFITPWLFQSWNLAYNVSVESDRVNDKYFYITRGIELLAEGERQNRDHPDIRFSIGFYLQHKICNSDETNVMRSLFQLSCIPPNERDPARFRVGTTNEFNWAEFEKFCKEHPQLARRLRDGLRRDTKSEQERQFTCERPDDVVQFLRDNWRVPSLYVDVLPTPDDSAWQPTRRDTLRPVEERFPVLPPPRSPQLPQHLFEPADSFKELTHDSPLRDDVNGYSVARAWFGYAQEPIPDPDELPGFTQAITDRARQRKPRNMTTLIFRNYPALAQSHLCELLQQEGWFDTHPWDIPGWFQHSSRGNQFSDGTPAQLAVPFEQSSQKGWEYARDMWIKHGERNHILFRDEIQEINMRQLAEAYWGANHLPSNSRPIQMPDFDPRLPQSYRDRKERLDNARILELLSPAERELYKAARYLYEYTFYRQLTNFAHHIMRVHVEAEEKTVTSRRLMYLAETYRLQGSPELALQAFNDPNAIPAWRDEVLSVQDPNKHKEFRHDSFIQEQTFEVQLKYLDVINDLYGRQLKRKITDLLALMSLAGQQGRAPGGSVLVPENLSLAWANYLNPPGTLAMFRGPFDVDLPDDRPLQPQEIAAGAAVLACPLAPAPLLAVTPLAARMPKPLLNPETVRMVLDRKNLLPKKPAEAPPTRPGSPSKPNPSTEKGPQ